MKKLLVPKGTKTCMPHYVWQQALIFVSAIWCVNLLPTQASGSSTDYLWPTVIAGSVVVSSPFAIGNFVYVGKGYKPPAVWRIGGYVMGTLDILSGLGMIITGTAAEGACDTGNCGDFFYITGGVLIAMGGINIVSSILSGNLPTKEKKEKWYEHVGVSPILLRDSNNSLAGGIAVSLVGW